jgi:hypothetical protein
MQSHDPHRLRAVAVELHKGSVLAATLAFTLALQWHAVSASERTKAMGRVYLPLIAGPCCAPIPSESYAAVSVTGAHPHLAAEVHPDLNLAVRGYAPTSAELDLVDYGGSVDPAAPQLAGLLSRGSTVFAAAYQVFDWDWDAMRRGLKIASPQVTALALRVRPGETIHVPASGYTIGNGWEVLVLYASQGRITLKYTREDSVVYGYTLHVENVCIEPRLLSLYKMCEARGRNYLPALSERQAFGHARANQVVVAIRDHGCFLDPRSRKDWWQGY